jgi:hypothetical protein
MNEITKEAKDALGKIIDYIGCDNKYKQYAALITYIERAIRNCNKKEG